MRKNFKDVGFYPQPVLIIGTYDTDGVKGREPRICVCLPWICFGSMVFLTNKK